MHMVRIIIVLLLMLPILVNAQTEGVITDLNASVGDTSSLSNRIDDNTAAINAIPSTGGYNANLYLSADTSSLDSNYHKLSYINDIATTEVSGVTNNDTVLIAQYLFGEPINTTTIEQGVWNFNGWGKVSSAVGVTQYLIEFGMYDAADSSLTELFTIASGEVDYLTYTEISFNQAYPQFDVNADEYGYFKIYATTTHNNNITASYKVGDGTPAYFNIPVAFRHSLLRSPNEIDSIQHITLDQKNNLAIKNDTNTFTKQTTVQDIEIQGSATGAGTLLTNLTTPISTTGKITSKYYIGQLQVGGDSTQTLTNANQYYTLACWRDSVLQNFTSSDSTLVVSSDGEGYYIVDAHLSMGVSGASVIHFSFFINDVEIVDMGEAERKVAINDTGNAGFHCRIWIPNNAVLKVKIKSDGAGDTVTYNHGGFGLHRIN